MKDPESWTLHALSQTKETLIWAVAKRKLRKGGDL